MIDHTGIGVADVARSAKFYDAALGALGLRRVMQIPSGVGSDAVGYGVDYPIFWIDKLHPHSVQQHTAFVAKSRAEVDAFHVAAMKAGGTENDAPGLRDTAKGYPLGYYAAFVRDPDGNIMEAVFRVAKPLHHRRPPIRQDLPRVPPLDRRYVESWFETLVSHLTVALAEARNATSRYDD
ncbi:VOC family protein [Achromobacter sp. DH1f]|uniref:VOC family protein n=1 Tax=Achromobacter sp. DH1f TaxID=1397275 RepID=UPI00046A6D83